MILDFKKELVKSGRIINGEVLTEDKYFIKAISDTITIKKFEEDLSAQDQIDSLAICKDFQIHKIGQDLEEDLMSGYIYLGATFDISQHKLGEWNAIAINKNAFSYPFEVRGIHSNKVSIQNSNEMTAYYGGALTAYMTKKTVYDAKNDLIDSATTYDEVLSITYS